MREEVVIKQMNNDEMRDFCIRKDYEMFKKDKEIERLTKIINKAKDISINLQNRYGYILDDLTYLLMQGSDK